MIPSSEQIEGWADFSQEDEGWVRIPLAAWPDLLWCIRQAEALEQMRYPSGESVEGAEASSCAPDS